jgi:acetyl-CoA synthetase
MKFIRKKLKSKPNLPDYKKAARKFKWKDHYKEIDFFSGRLNAAYNAVDRHDVPNKVALYWIGDKEERKYTFRQMQNLSNKFANVLKKLSVKKGDRVFIFLPRVPELYISFLGILKTGAIAGTLFAAFGPKALKDRLENSSAKVLITDSHLRKRINEIRKDLPDLKKIIVIDKPKKGDVDYKREMAMASRHFKVRMMKPDEPAFMLYTSGTTGKPKGVMHCHKAIVQEHLTAKWVLDLKPDDIYWCTADPGWVTGIAYSILGSWSNKVSSIVYAGRFDPDTWYKIIEKYQVSVWYTAPTAVRMLMRAGNAYKKYDMSSLRHICSVGEPLNPEPIYWGLKAFKLPFHDNWWQTEAGGILIANYPCMPIKPGSMGKPFPGVEAAIVDENGNKIRANKEGNLAIKPNWPAMMIKIWKNGKKYRSYFKKGWYISGDKAYKDNDGYYWFIGRADDVIKTAGERVGPFEVESALIEHKAIVEAAVIGKPDPLRGEIIKAFIILAKGYKPSKQLEEEIKTFIKKRLAGHAYPREIEFVDSLPKTQSGKIVRRLLKARELGLPVGDVSTLEKY